jgi:hypothetical protein
MEIMSILDESARRVIDLCRQAEDTIVRLK